MGVALVLVGLLGLLVAVMAGVAVVIGRRRAAPVSLVEVEARLAHAGDDWWRVTLTVLNRGAAEVPPTAFADGRPISVALPGAQAAEWYGVAPIGWALDAAGSLLLAPTALLPGAPLSATVVVHGRPEVRIDAPLRSIPVREEVLDDATAWRTAPVSPVAPPGPRPVDAPLIEPPVRESVMRGGFGVWVSMAAGVLGAALIGVGIALGLAGAESTAVGAPGVVLILVAVVGIVGTLVVRLLRRWLEPPTLWRTPRQRLQRPGTIVSLALTGPGVLLFCLEFAAQGSTGELTGFAAVGLVLLLAGGVTAAITGLVRLVTVLQARPPVAG